ncbi:hypothetical protein ACUN0C_15235 [Faunimonas sp. B44]|uniref:hypothetical protein n=1 Tax=Faunimonas sp. B44 TaxID=3461493 RepID=UPI00404403C9
MRRQLLVNPPEPGNCSLADLYGIARAMESDAAERYRGLALDAERRGQPRAAATFERLRRQAEEHAAELSGQASALTVAMDERRALRRIPAEFAAAWDDIRGSALVTPYRILAKAVENEERAFVFFAYLAAQAADRAVMKEAERIAMERLARAADLRQARRAAFRETRREIPPAEVDGLAELEALIAAGERDIEARHREVARALAECGDEGSAQLLLNGLPPQAGVLPASPAEPKWRGSDPVHLLTAALTPLERLGEALESVLKTTSDEAVYRLAQARLEPTVRRSSALRRRIEGLITAEQDGAATRAPA